MRILQINLTYKNGSTGKIMDDINKRILGEGNESYMLYAYSSFDTPVNGYRMYSNNMSVAVRKHLLESRITGLMGYGKKQTTQRAIEWIKQIKPDVIHLHNIHGNWINLEKLFDYIKESNTPVIWTLHDCWSFTGRCSHFENIGCDKWKTGCFGCKNKRTYPITYFFDFSKTMWKDKKKWFAGVKTLTIAVPSKWLKNKVQDSFLKEYDIRVIPNGIDVDTFKMGEKKVVNKKVILGVANSWNMKKGFHTFIKLDEIIDHEKYQIILVGLNQKQMTLIPDTIIGIKRTNSINELVGYYQQAFVFVNPSVEETQGLTTIEAMACGIPVIVSNSTAVPECVGQDCGVVIDNISAKKILDAIEVIAKNRSTYSECCRQYVEEKYDKEKRYMEYLNEYQKLCRN